jgi:hypothetical protein
MAKVGRNSPCLCGSGKKYKRCCEKKEAEMRANPLLPGRFRYEHGSYGGPGGYMPSILCYKETGPDSWVEHFCLVKPEAIFDEEHSALEVAEKHLAEARSLMDDGGTIQDFALSLRHAGYKSITDFRAVGDGGGV